jgi:hypothetical protein
MGGVHGYWREVGMHRVGICECLNVWELDSWTLEFMGIKLIQAVLNRF